jgi:hypothetical protein
VPVKAAELYAAAHRALDEPLAELGFRRLAKASPAGWLRSEGDRWLMLWFQPSRWNGPTSAGYAFTVELRLADRAVLYAPGPLARLPRLLSPADRERLRRMENGVIARLPPPNMALFGSLPAEVRATMLAGWQPRRAPYAPDEEVWFRQQDRADVDELLAFIAEVLPGAIERFAARLAEPAGGTILRAGTPAWDRLTAQFNSGPGARAWRAVVESRVDLDALDEALSLWRELFGEWLAAQGLELAQLSPDEIVAALVGGSGRSA